MAKQRPFRLPVPKTLTRMTFQALEENETRLRFTKEEVYSVMNYLLYKHVHLKKGERYFFINRRYLKELIDKDPMPFIWFLSKHGILEGDRKWKKGQKQQYYRLSRRLNWEIAELKPGSPQFERKRKYHLKKRKHDNRLEPHLKIMADYYRDVSFDYEGAMKQWRSSRYGMKKKIKHLCQIEAMADERLRSFRRNHTNLRLDTSLTCLKSDYREFLVGYFAHADKRSSQPYLFSQTLNHLVGKDGKRAAFFGNFGVFTHINPLISSNSNKISINSQHSNPYICVVFSACDPAKTFGRRALKKIFKIPHFCHKYGLNNLALSELNEFSVLVNHGTLYQKLMGCFSTKNLTPEQAKKKVKEMVFGLFFSQNVKYNEDGTEWIPYQKKKALFAEVFPFISEVIKILKMRNYKDLSVYLQRVESYIFIDCICRELVEAGIIPLTIHDSIIVEMRHEQRAIEIMERVFRHHFEGMPTIRVTYLGTGEGMLRPVGESTAESPKMRPERLVRDGVDVTAASMLQKKESA
jgi:hypothetical protein